MSGEHLRQPRPLASEPGEGATDTPYLTAEEAARYLRFRSVAALYKAIPVAGIPVCRRGRSLLFHKGDLDRWLAGESVSAIRRDARHARKVEPFRNSEKSEPVASNFRGRE